MRGVKVSDEDGLPLHNTATHADTMQKRFFNRFSKIITAVLFFPTQIFLLYWLDLRARAGEGEGDLRASPHDARRNFTVYFLNVVSLLSHQKKKLFMVGLKPGGDFSKVPRQF